MDTNGDRRPGLFWGSAAGQVPARVGPGVVKGTIVSVASFSPAWRSTCWLRRRNGGLAAGALWVSPEAERAFPRISVLKRQPAAMALNRIVQLEVVYDATCAAVVRGGPPDDGGLPSRGGRRLQRPDLRCHADPGGAFGGCGRRQSRETTGSWPSFVARCVFTKSYPGRPDGMFGTHK